jgi:hypothetical protein
LVASLADVPNALLGLTQSELVGYLVEQIKTLPVTAMLLKNYFSGMVYTFR